MAISYFTKLSGTSFHQEELSKVKPRVTPLRLVPRPDNEYDQYAVEVQALLDDWVQIGWIQKGHNQELQKVLLDGEDVLIECTEITGQDKSTLGCNVGIAYGKDDSADAPKQLPKQIVVLGDEPYIWWDEANHKAYSPDMKELYSGSKVEKAPFGEFDPTYPAKALSKKTGVKPQDIVDMWTWNGDVASRYGTLVHEALEHYWLYNEQMMMLDDAKKRECRAWNWMPDDLGRIVEAFLKHLRTWNSVKPEVRIKYQQYTGIVDLLEEMPDRYIIHDYKITNEIKDVKYPCLEGGKVPFKKYTLQQNCYRYIIEQVTGKETTMMLHQWNGEKWTAHALPRVADNIFKEELWKKK